MMQAPRTKHGPRCSGTISIRRGGQTLGPYTEDQVREMVRDGILYPIDSASFDGSGDWMPLYSLLGINIPPPPAPAQQHISPAAGQSHGDTLFRTLELQSRMKSKAVAVLLALFIPFLGCFYSAPLAAIVCTISGGFFLIALAQGADGLALLLFFVCYVLSIFRAIAGVDRHNAAVIAQARLSGV